MGGEIIPVEVENSQAYNELYANRGDSAHDGTIFANSQHPSRGQTIAPVLFEPNSLSKSPARKQNSKPKVVKMKKKLKAANG